MTSHFKKKDKRENFTITLYPLVELTNVQQIELMDSKPVNILRHPIKINKKVERCLNLSKQKVTPWILFECI